LLLYSSYLPLGVPNWPVILHHQHRAINRNQDIFWRRCRGKRRLLQGEFCTHILYFVLSFAFTLFLLVSFYQKYKKKIVTTIVVIFVGLLLSCFMMLSINGWFL
jgi:hypothetical protein